LPGHLREFIWAYNILLEGRSPNIANLRAAATKYVRDLTEHRLIKRNSIGTHA
jgi:hypothetical protein